jgi:hypothetical protein
MFPHSQGGLFLQKLRYIPRRDIECTRCHQVLPITEFPPEYIIGNKKNPLCRTCKKERFKALRERFAKERATRENYPTEKECKGCGKFKPLSDFTESLSYKDGLHSHCRECQAKKNRQMKNRWKKERKKTKPPEEKLCTSCYRIYPISFFCSNVSHKDGYDNICRECLIKRNEKYAERWIEERKVAPPKEKKRCPGCKKKLPISKFWSHEKRKDGLSNYCIDCAKRIIQKNVVKWKKQREKQPNLPQKKTCIICNISKPLDKFYPNKRYKDGYSGSCIVCEEKRAQKYIKQWVKEGNVLPKEKRCCRCKRVLSSDHFVFNKRKRDGLSSSCRDCEKLKREEYIIKWEKERKQKETERFTLFPKFEKKCTQCGQTKSLGLFFPSKNSKDGHTSYCKDCGLKHQNEYHERIKASKKVIPETKYCTSCNKTLPASKFNKCNQRKDGLNIYCRDCSNKKQREYMSRPENKKRRKEYERKYQKKPEIAEKRRAYARKYYNRPEVKAKVAAYRKKHRADPEVRKRRNEQAKEYYQRKKKEKKLRNVA